MLQRNSLSTIARAKDCHIPWTLDITLSNLSGVRFHIMEADCTLLVSYISNDHEFDAWVSEIKFTDTRQIYDATSDKWSEREHAYVINDKYDGELFEFLTRFAISNEKLLTKVEDMIRSGEVSA